MSLARRIGVVRMLTAVAVLALGGARGAVYAAPAQQDGNRVAIQGFQFRPQTLNVTVGTTVTWTNQDQQPHTATSRTEGRFDTGTLQQGQSGSATFNEAGTFEYFCRIHPNMTGTVVVTAAQQQPTATPPPVEIALDVRLQATLVGGAEEVPNPGDPDGRGTSIVMLRTATNQVCWETTVSNITLPAAASHIHRGARGVAGPIVVPLTAPDANGRASGCANAEASLMREIAQNPAGFYVNVHTSDFPGGAVRGQLAQAPPEPAPVPAGPAPAPAPAPAPEAAPAPAPAAPLPNTGEAPAPAALPNTGTSGGTAALLTGLALLVVLAGLGVSWSVRRRTGAR